MNYLVLKFQDMLELQLQVPHLSLPQIKTHNNNIPLHLRKPLRENLEDIKALDEVFSAILSIRLQTLSFPPKLRRKLWKSNSQRDSSINSMRIPKKKRIFSRILIGISLSVQTYPIQAAKLQKREIRKEDKARESE